MGGHGVPNEGEKMTVGVSFPAKGCLTSHNRSEINKMKLKESEYKSLGDAGRVTGFTKPMSVCVVKHNNAVTIYSIVTR